MASNNVKTEVLLQHGSTLYSPVVAGDITVEWTRYGSPGKMTLSIIVDDVIKFEEGDVVRLRVDDRNFFFGILFTYEKEDFNKFRLITYDALRYFKNQDIWKNKKMSYGKLVKNICKRYKLKKGTIAATKYVKKKKIYTGTVFDMCEKYRKSTKSSTGKNFLLMAEWNRIVLKDQAKMKTDYVIEAGMMQNYSFSSSIDDKVYTVYKLYKSNKKKTTYSKTLTQSAKKYGRLVYVKPTKLKKKAKIKKRLKTLSQTYNKPRKKLTLTGVWGLPDIRAGSSLTVKLQDGSVSISKRMYVNTVTHKFSEGIHTMDMNMIGGDFKA